MSPGASSRRRAARWLLAALLIAAVLLLAAALLRGGVSEPASGRPPVAAATSGGSAPPLASSAPPLASSAPPPATSAGPATSADAAAAGSPASSLATASPRARRPIPEAELQRVVVAGAGPIKQVCWEKAQAAGASTATGARVTLAFTVGPAGALTRARATGGEAFAALDACVEGVARGWRFPTGYDETSSQAEFRFRTE